VNVFLNGASFAACLVIALFFFRFWRQTRDRLFGIFALAFAVFGANRAVLSALDEDADQRVIVYLIRLLAFLLILAAIIDKNRPHRDGDRLTDERG
jgi:hypothetical protein